MINIPLQAVPTQSLSIQLSNNNFNIRIHTCDNTPQTPGSMVTVFTVSINDVLIVSDVRIVPSTALINYEYLENGNFYFITENDDYPDYTLFGVSQFLIYASPDELGAIINGTTT